MCKIIEFLGGIQMVKIGIITGSTRDSRVNLNVAEWVKSIADQRTDAEYELVDIKDYNLPRFNESIPPIMSGGDYQTPEAKPWSKKISELDGFVFVSPEYNKSVTSGLKDAIDYLYVEWNHKAAGVVSYGSTLGVTVTNDLRLILSVPKVAVVGPSVNMSLFTDFQDMTKFNPAPHHEESLNKMLDEVVAWSNALKTVRG
jgi:NAD(P)H-dependent FMN reductase